MAISIIAVGRVQKFEWKNVCRHGLAHIQSSLTMECNLQVRGSKTSAKISTVNRSLPLLSIDK